MIEKFAIKNGVRIPIRKFLFQRFSHIENRNIPVCVEAENYDHAVTRLLAEWPSLAWREWDYIMELESQHDLGKLGTTLKFQFQEKH